MAIVAPSRFSSHRLFRASRKEPGGSEGRAKRSRQSNRPGALVCADHLYRKNEFKDALRVLEPHKKVAQCDALRACLLMEMGQPDRAFSVCEEMSQTYKVGFP